MKNRIYRIRDKLKHLPRRQIIWISVCVICFLLWGILHLYSRKSMESLPDQNEASRWSENGGVSQVSLFFTQDADITQDRIREFEYYIDKALTENSITETSPDTGARLWADCYSAYGSVTLTNGSKNVTVNAIGVGGDFFLFHPLTLVKGAFFEKDNLMKDQIVIDEDTAWQLFGSDNVVGQSVTIGSVPHYISGVVKRNRGRLQDAAGLSQSYVYLSYESLKQYGTISSAGIVTGQSQSGSGSTSSGGTGTMTAAAPQTQQTSTSSGNGGSSSAAKSTAGNATAQQAVTSASDGDSSQDGGIGCYEVVMPGPVRGFAASLLREKLSLPQNQMSVIDNTARFDVPALLKVLMSFGTRSMQEMPINYPYWENIARGWEDILALILLIKAICIIIPVLIITVMIIQAYRHKKWTAGSVWKSLMDRKYDMESHVRYHNDKWKYF